MQLLHLFFHMTYSCWQTLFHWHLRALELRTIHVSCLIWFFWGVLCTCLGPIYHLPFLSILRKSNQSTVYNLHLQIFIDICTWNNALGWVLKKAK
jgi:hypothetical protein